jgi:hypothetical protein
MAARWSASEKRHQAMAVRRIVAASSEMVIAQRGSGQGLVNSAKYKKLLWML